MDNINELSDELLVKILSFVPTKVSVSTSILSKRWEYLWMWVPKLEYDEYKDIILCTRNVSEINDSMPSLLRYRDFIAKYLPLHKAPIIDSLCFKFGDGSYQPEDIKLWVGIAVSRCVRELRIGYCSSNEKPDVVLPSSLYSCKSLVMLELTGEHLVDVPPTVCLPSLQNLATLMYSCKTLQLLCVTYFSEDSLPLLLSYCPVLEDLVIELHGYDNVEALVVIVPSLQRLSLRMDDECSYDASVIDTSSLKYLKVEDYRYGSSYLIKHMPKLEEADITVGEGIKELLESITSVKRLSLEVDFDNNEKSMYCDGIVFNQLEHLKLSICSDYWSEFLVRLLNDSPKLRVLNLSVDLQYQRLREHEQINWSDEDGSIPECLLKTLETFEFAGCKGRPEERDFLSFFFKNARCLKSTSILHSSCD